MALTQISPDPTLAEVIQSATTAAFSSRDKVMLRSRDITEHPAAVAVVVGILAILTLVICLWFCIWLRHREKDVSYATPLPVPDLASRRERTTPGEAIVAAGVPSGDASGLLITSAFDSN